MKVLIVSLVFPPEFTYSAATSHDLASELAKQGHDVTVLAPFPNKPAGKLFPGYERRLYCKSRAPEGFALVHCFSTLAPESRMLSRFLENISFGVSSALRVLFGKRPDALYVNTWPIFATLLVLLAAKVRGIPSVLCIQDLYPEVLAMQERLSRETRAYRLLQWLDGAAARMTDRLLVVSEKFVDPYVQARGIRADKVEVLHNWGDPAKISIDKDASAEYRRQRGIPDNAKLFVYAGNVGPASGADTMVDAFALLQNMPDAHLLIAGSGSMLGKCRDVASRRSLSRVHFHSPWALEQTSLILGAADVLLLPTQGRQSISSMPSKLISYMFAGKPILASVLPISESSTFIQKAHAGWIVAPDSPEELANAVRGIVRWATDAALAEMGESARKWAMENLSRESNLPRLIRHILILGNGKEREVAMSATAAD